MSWGIKHGALKITHKGSILPLLLYGTPVWIEALQYEHNRLKFITVQSLMNIRMVKAFRTSSEAPCILTGVTPIIIKTQKAVQKYIGKKNEAIHTYLTEK
jgi:hypothetical protein